MCLCPCACVRPCCIHTPRVRVETVDNADGAGGLMLVVAAAAAVAVCIGALTSGRFSRGAVAVPEPADIAEMRVAWTGARVQY